MASAAPSSTKIFANFYKCVKSTSSSSILLRRQNSLGYHCIDVCSYQIRPFKHATRPKLVSDFVEENSRLFEAKSTFFEETENKGNGNSKQRWPSHNWQFEENVDVNKLLQEFKVDYRTSSSSNDVIGGINVDTDDVRPLAVLFGWAGSNFKLMEKYASPIYRDVGFNTLSYVVPTKINFEFPASIHLFGLKLVQELIRIEPHLNQTPIVIHAFSDTGLLLQKHPIGHAAKFIGSPGILLEIHGYNHLMSENSYDIRNANILQHLQCSILFKSLFVILPQHIFQCT